MGPQRGVRGGLAGPRLWVAREELGGDYEATVVFVPHVGLPVGENVSQYHHLGLEALGAVDCHHPDSVSRGYGDGFEGAGAALPEVPNPVCEDHRVAPRLGCERPDDFDDLLDVLSRDGIGVGGEEVGPIYGLVEQVD